LLNILWDVQDLEGILRLLKNAKDLLISFLPELLLHELSGQVAASGGHRVLMVENTVAVEGEVLRLLLTDLEALGQGSVALATLRSEHVPLLDDDLLLVGAIEPAASKVVFVPHSVGSAHLYPRRVGEGLLRLRIIVQALALIIRSLLRRRIARTSALLLSFRTRAVGGKEGLLLFEEAVLRGFGQLLLHKR